jgi:hypothetical protein
VTRVAVLVLVLALVACTRAPAAIEPPSGRITTPRPAEPSVLPLLADELAPSFDARARLAYFDHVWLDDQAPIAKRPDSAGLDRAEYIVVDERGDRVRLRVDDDWVRVLVWVQRDQLRPAIIRDVAADGRDRAIAPGASLSFVAGASLTVEAGMRGARVIVEDEHLTAYGTVPAHAIGDVWHVAPADDADADATSPPGSVVDETDILDAPVAGAQVLARTGIRYAATVEHPSPAPGWRLVTLDSDYISVTGYVPDSAWLPKASGIMTGSFIEPMGGGGIELPVGTCLYAHPEGALVGVMLVAQHDARRARRGWARWEWGTWWGRVPLYARPAGDGFESCQSPPRAAHASRSISNDHVPRLVGASSATSSLSMNSVRGISVAPSRAR